MQIRKAEFHDLDEIMSVYEQARQFMVLTGNPNQWAVRNWPPRALIEQDIAQGKSYVCEDGDAIAAVFFYEYGEDIDPTYRHIEDGAWLAGGPYGVVHRIAARGGKGAGRFCIDWAYSRCGHLRIDTHADNHVMQRVLKSLGFTYCGIIHIVEDNAPRLAFEKYQP